jgi:ATP-dependent exoDNAse (exonuclease V) beta subunit
MEQVDWLRDQADESAIMKRWAEHRLDQQPAFDQAQAMALNVIRSSTCRSAFTPANARTKLWRERPFDLVKPDGEWISGTVDRVLVDYDANGRATQATIIDFKTDDIADDAALAEKLKGYQPQIALYRDAVAKLAGLSLSAVSASLLFTRAPLLVAMA